MDYLWISDQDVGKPPGITQRPEPVLPGPDMGAPEMEPRPEWAEWGGGCSSQSVPVGAPGRHTQSAVRGQRGLWPQHSPLHEGEEGTWGCKQDFQPQTLRPASHPNSHSSEHTSAPELTSPTWSLACRQTPLFWMYAPGVRGTVSDLPLCPQSLEQSLLKQSAAFTQPLGREQTGEYAGHCRPAPAPPRLRDPAGSCTLSLVCFLVFGFVLFFCFF